LKLKIYKLGDNKKTSLEKKYRLPADIKPMLATLVDKPFDEKGWLYEIKWDGYRTIAYINSSLVELKSRNNKSFNEKFYPIYDALKKWKINAVVDGEIIVVNENGIPDFSKLQSWRSETDGELLFYVFDLLWLNGNDITQLPLSERKAILKKTLPFKGNIRFSESFSAGATEFFEVAKKMELEGIMAKKEDSKNYPGERTKEWLKIKTGKRQEVVIGGYTCNKGSKKPFSALLVGVHENARLEYTGKIGTGFSVSTQKQMLELFKPLVISKCPFSHTPDINKPSRFRPNPPNATATWLKPRLVCEVSYAEITSDGVMRHPSFEGMRSDKSSHEVVKENERSTNSIVHPTRKNVGNAAFKNAEPRHTQK
jgi:bifunctional non-homologous end joining protein LigD